MSVEELTCLQMRPKRLIAPNDPVPTLPDAGRIGYHNVTHIPHVKWCNHCVEGRMTKDQSLTVPKEEKKRERERERERDLTLWEVKR